MAPSNAEADSGSGIVALDPRFLETLRQLERQSERDLVAPLAREFLAQTPEQVATLRRALAECDERTLADVAHSLTGNAGLLGALRLAEASRELERLAKEDGLDQGPRCLGELESELRRVEIELLRLTDDKPS